MNTALIGKASGAGNFIYQLYTHKMRHEIADTRRLGLKYKMHIYRISKMTAMKLLQ